MGVVFILYTRKGQDVGKGSGGVRFVKGPKSDNHVGFCDDIL